MRVYLKFNFLKGIFPGLRSGEHTAVFKKGLYKNTNLDDMSKGTKTHTKIHFNDFSELLSIRLPSDKLSQAKFGLLLLHCNDLSTLS